MRSADLMPGFSLTFTAVIVLPKLLSAQTPECVHDFKSCTSINIHSVGPLLIFLPSKQSKRSSRLHPHDEAPDDHYHRPLSRSLHGLIFPPI